MDYTKLGRSDIDVSVHALGCWPFAGGPVWGDQNDNDSISTVHAALEAGITFFDTAEGYGDGHSEVVLGKALKSHRKQAVIATKVSASNLSPEAIFEACERSLQRLDTEYIDLYQIHWPNPSVPLAESLRALESLKQEGKIRAIGVCNFGVHDLKELSAISRTETDQLPYGLLWRPIEYDIRPKCIENKIGIICYSPLSQGLLTGRYTSANQIPPGLARSRHFSKNRPMAKHGEDGCEFELFETLKRLTAIAEELDNSLANVALAWARQQSGVKSLLIGARNREELNLNLKSLEIVIQQDELQKLTNATEAIKSYLGTNADMWMSPSRIH